MILECSDDMVIAIVGRLVGPSCALRESLLDKIWSGVRGISDCIDDLAQAHLDCEANMCPTAGEDFRCPPMYGGPNKPLEKLLRHILYPTYTRLSMATCNFDTEETPPHLSIDIVVPTANNTLLYTCHQIDFSEVAPNFAQISVVSRPCYDDKFQFVKVILQLFEGDFWTLDSARYRSYDEQWVVCASRLESSTFEQATTTALSALGNEAMALAHNMGDTNEEKHDYGATLLASLSCMLGLVTMAGIVRCAYVIYKNWCGGGVYRDTVESQEADGNAAPSITRSIFGSFGRAIGWLRRGDGSTFVPEDEELDKPELLLDDKGSAVVLKQHCCADPKHLASVTLTAVSTGASCSVSATLTLQ
jgi:hypothetical protein